MFPQQNPSVWVNELSSTVYQDNCPSDLICLTQQTVGAAKVH